MESKFRVNAKKVFLTYSQYDLPKAMMLNHFEQIGGPLKEYVIANEHHKDGNHHIHAVLHYENKLDIKNPRAFDSGDCHPNIKTLKTVCDFNRACAYIMKEDPEPLKLLLTRTKEEKNQQIYKELMQEGPDKLMMTGKIHPIQYSGYKRTYNEHLATLNVDEREDLPTELENPWQTPFKVDIEKKKCHLWLYSHRPNQGKTTWVDGLTEKYRAEYYSYTETFQAQIFPSLEVIILDEFRGQLKVHQLNQMCDGKMFFTKKGQPNFRLMNKPLVIVCSNKMISEVYKNALDVELVYARFMEIEVSLPNNIVEANERISGSVDQLDI